MDIKEFLQKNRIDWAQWEAASVDWDLLRAIAADHDSQSDSLRDTAELFARVIQRLPSVHSVRWRIKDTDHLLAKIIRKRSEGNKKYKEISLENYFEIVTDLVGLRALHLFKDDCFQIDSAFRGIWTTVETPIAYLREGDPPELTAKFQEKGFEVKYHPAGYRSIHYVCASQPLLRKVLAEIQVRTIFEEGWSEIDHRIRYPNFSDDQLVAYFLTIFNRLAGSADEMGTFVQGLTNALHSLAFKVNDANRQKEEALLAMDEMLSDLEKMKKQDAEARKKLSGLQQEVSKLRQLSATDAFTGSSHVNALAALAGSDSNKRLVQHALRASAVNEYLNALRSNPLFSKSLPGSGD